MRGAPGVASGEDAPDPSPYEVHLGVDLGLTLGAGFLIVPRLLVDQGAGPACGLDCDPGGLNALDRLVIGNRSAGAETASDATAAVCIALPVVIDGLDVLISGGDGAWRGFGKDMLVTVETAALTMGAYSLLNLVVRRHRPLVYDGARSDALRTAPDAAMSFPSGHTAISFSMATAAAFTFTRRHPDSPWVAPVWIGALGLAAATGVLRTEAGRHFWTDVIAGATLGTGLGLLVPYLHLRPDRGPVDGPRVELAPILVPGGAGLALSLR